MLASIPCRLAIVSLLSAVALLTLGKARPPEGQFHSGLSRDKFWLVKLRADAAYDAVLAGDSRALSDLDPASMSAALSSRVLNFGFNVAALSPEYIDAAASKLDPRSPNRRLIIGVTPRSLTPVNAKLSGYEEEDNRSVDEQFFNWHLNGLNEMFRPVSLPLLILRIRGVQVGYTDHMPNGWMPVSLRPHSAVAQVAVYNRIFVKNQVSSSMEEAFLQKILELSRAGIRVVGVRLPVAPALLDAENRMSGFDEAAFIHRFEAAGGQWVPSPAGSFTITDGSHIDAADAPRYSSLLAAAIRDAERTK